MIKINNLNYGYKRSEPIIKNLTYQFQRETSYLITGHNGVGKTTLIRLILGLLKPQLGTISVNEEAIVSYLPDFNGIYDDLTVMDNVIFRLSLYKIKFTDKEETFYALLQQYHLVGKEKELVRNLSLGMKKKVAFICSMIIEPDIYILDEPTGGIDAESTIEVLNLMNELSEKGKLIICISHEEIIKQGFKATHLSLEGGVLSECINIKCS